MYVFFNSALKKLNKEKWFPKSKKKFGVTNKLFFEVRIKFFHVLKKIWTKTMSKIYIEYEMKIIWLLKWPLWNRSLWYSSENLGLSVFFSHKLNNKKKIKTNSPKNITIKTNGLKKYNKNLKDCQRLLLQTANLCCLRAANPCFLREANPYDLMVVILYYL